MAYYATYMPNENGEMQKVVINAGVGFILPYYGETAPPGTLACDGSEISRAAYDELFQVLGTKAGAGDGSTTFNLPDLRGQFVRGVGGNSAELGVKQGDAIRNITGFWNIRRGYSEDNDVAWDLLSANGTLFGITDGESAGTCITGTGPNAAHQRVNFNAANVVPIAAENRPVNVALLWCIIYE